MCGFPTNGSTMNEKVKLRKRLPKAIREAIRVRKTARLMPAIVRFPEAEGRPRLIFNYGPVLIRTAELRGEVLSEETKHGIMELNAGYNMALNLWFERFLNERRNKA